VTTKLRELLSELKTSMTEATAPDGKISSWLKILSIQLTNYEQDLMVADIKRSGSPNSWRTPATADVYSITQAVASIKDSDSPQAMERLKMAIHMNFRGQELPLPVAKLVKQIDAFVDSGKLPNLPAAKKVPKILKVPETDLSSRHGGPRDRGSADAYYGRRKDPHKYAGITGRGERVALTNPAEIAAYNDAHDRQDDRKNWDV